MNIVEWLLDGNENRKWPVSVPYVSNSNEMEKTTRKQHTRINTCYLVFQIYVSRFTNIIKPDKYGLLSVPWTIQDQ